MVIIRVPYAFIHTFFPRFVKCVQSPVSVRIHQIYTLILT